MSLTSTDLQKIEGLISKGFVMGFEKYVVPYVDAKLDEFEQKMDERFDKIDQRFEEIDEKFEQIDKKFEQIDRRFEKIDLRFEQIDRRFEQIDLRFEQIDRRFEQIDQHFEEIEGQMVNFRSDLRSLKKQMDEQYLTLLERIDQNTGLISYYFKQCVYKDEFEDHERRLKALEI